MFGPLIPENVSDGTTPAATGYGSVGAMAVFATAPTGVLTTLPKL